MVRPAGFEPATYGLEVRCSIQLSYERLIFLYYCTSYYQHSTISDDIILKVFQKATSFVLLFHFSSSFQYQTVFRIDDNNTVFYQFHPEIHRRRSCIQAN
jgi:hypothetical protein